VNSEHALQVDRPAIGVHGRKRSHRLSIAGRNLMDSLLPILAVPLRTAAINPALLFSTPPRDVWVEVGFGDGAHLAWRAAENPQAGFIGCEPYVNGVARLLETISETGLENIRIHPGDARILLAALPAASIARIYILFPDPWPRKRHHKRRFMSLENIDALARVLRPGGELRFATDNADYCLWTQRLMQDNPDFTQAAIVADGAPVTRYEAKAGAAGRKPRHLRFVRKQPHGD
jgi:tRNA (guanine-N7-)-methyltransferase